MSGRPLVNFFRAVLLVMVLIVVALISAIATMHFAIHGTEVQVPDLKGMTEAQAHSQTAGLGLNLGVDNHYYSADVATGHILTQSPPAGTVVRRGWHVRVSESLGPQSVTVPNTVGMDERIADIRLQSAGLGIGATVRMPYAGAAEGTVLAQDPPGNSVGIEKPSVSLLVAAADDETAGGYVMPDMKGLPVVTAQAELAKVGIRTATPRYVDVPIEAVGTGDARPGLPVKPGAVIAQQPPAGARVDQSTRVMLTVAK